MYIYIIYTFSMLWCDASLLCVYILYIHLVCCGVMPLYYVYIYYIYIYAYIREIVLLINSYIENLLNVNQ